MPAKKTYGARSSRPVDDPLNASLNGPLSGPLTGPLTGELPLRNHTERALTDYLASLNGDRPARLYDLVLREVEEPLFRTVLDYAAGNQSRAAGILGINRGTLRKKLRELGLSG